MKIVIILVSLIVVIAVVGAFVLDRYIKKEVKRILAEQTGFDFGNGFFKTSLFSTRVEMRDVTVHNPPDFPEPVAFVINRVFVDIDPWSLLRDKTHFEEVAIDIPQIVVVRKANGETNMRWLMRKIQNRSLSREEEQYIPPVVAVDVDPAAQRSEEPGVAAVPAETVAPSAAQAPAAEPKGTSRGATKPKRPYKIDKFALKVDRVEYHRYSDDAAPTVVAVDLNFDQEARDVEKPGQIGMMLAHGLAASALQSVFNGGEQNIVDLLHNTKVREHVKKVGKNVKRAFKNLLKPKD